MVYTVINQLTFLFFATVLTSIIHPNNSFFNCHSYPRPSALQITVNVKTPYHIHDYSNQPKY